MTTLEDTERIARRVLGGAHPTTVGIGRTLQSVRAAFGDRSLLSFEISLGGANLPDVLFFALVVAVLAFVWAWALEPFWRY